MQFSSWMGQVSKSSYFASANDMLMTKITKFQPQVVFQYGFRSFLQHRNIVNRLVQLCIISTALDVPKKNFCCFICVSYGPYTLLQNDSFLHLYANLKTLC